MDEAQVSRYIKEGQSMVLPGFVSSHTPESDWELEGYLKCHLLLIQSRLCCVTGARSVLFCAADKKVQEYARALRGLGYPLVPYFGSDCKPASVAHQAHDMEKAQLVWQQTLKLVDLPLDCIELVLSENDPVEVIENFKVIDSYPEDENEGALDFLMNDEDDAVTEIFWSWSFTNNSVVLFWMVHPCVWYLRFWPWIETIVTVTYSVPPWCPENGEPNLALSKIEGRACSSLCLIEANVYVVWEENMHSNGAEQYS